MMSLNRMRCLLMDSYPMTQLIRVKSREHERRWLGIDRRLD